MASETHVCSQCRPLTRYEECMLSIFLAWLAWRDKQYQERLYGNV